VVGILAIAAATYAIRIGCGGSADPGTGLVSDDDGDHPDGAAGEPGPQGSPAGGPIFVIAMENQDARKIYGNVSDAPYINGTLLVRYAHATAFGDELPVMPSEPHYLWMEAGTNAFPDHVFETNDKPSASNSTASGDHLVAQLAAAGLDWMSYQEGIDDKSGRCPIESSGFYHPRHNPFVFFQDVAGDPPSKDAPACVAHHRDLPALAADLAGGDVASYVFITPDFCHDMHGARACPNPNQIRSGDDWLAQNLPPLIDFVETHGGVIFVTWDEGDDTSAIPFLAIGPDVKPGYGGAVPYTHSALLKTVELLLGLPVLPAVASSNDLGDLFLP
jgi:hypothetical protein